MSKKEQVLTELPNLIPEQLSPENQAWLDAQLEKGREHTRKAIMLRQYGIVVSPIGESNDGDIDES